MLIVKRRKGERVVIWRDLTAIEGESPEVVAVIQCWKGTKAHLAIAMGTGLVADREEIFLRKAGLTSLPPDFCRGAAQ